MELQKSACQSRGVVGGHTDIGQMRRISAKDRIRGCFAHIADQPSVVPGDQFCNIEPKDIGQSQNHRRRYWAVVVFHLIEIGQRDLEPLGKFPLGKINFAP